MGAIAVPGSHPIATKRERSRCSRVHDRSHSHESVVHRKIPSCDEAIGSIRAPWNLELSNRLRSPSRKLGRRGQLSGGKPFAEFEQEFFKTFRPSSLLNRFAMTEEVANLVTYVCSPLSAATNGAALRVDGGVVQACF